VLPRSKPRKNYALSLFKVLLALVAFMVLANQYREGQQRNATASIETTTSKKPAFSIDKSPALQAKRLKLIQNLQKNSIIYKLDTTSVTIKLWVRPKFRILQFEEKETTAQLVYSYLWDESMLRMDILDSQTGNVIGEYHPVSGLDIY
jgi:hypothetical protein